MMSTTNAEVLQDFKAPIATFIQCKSWEKAVNHIKKRPKSATESCSIPGFYDKHSARVNGLQLACSKEDAPVLLIETLLRANIGGIKEVESTYQRNALHIAVMNKASYKVVSCLLKYYPAAASVQDIHGRLPMHYACKDEDGEQTIRCLLKAYPESTTVADDNGFLPIHVACRMGLPMSTVRLLLRTAPQSILAKTNKGSTPVHCAKLYKGNRDPVIQEQIIETLTTVAEETIKVVKEQGPLDVCYQSTYGGSNSKSPTSSKNITSVVLNKEQKHRNYHKGLSMTGGVPGQIQLNNDSLSSGLDGDEDNSSVISGNSK